MSRAPRELLASAFYRDVAVLASAIGVRAGRRAGWVCSSQSQSRATYSGEPRRSLVSKCRWRSRSDWRQSSPRARGATSSPAYFSALALDHETGRPRVDCRHSRRFNGSCAGVMPVSHACFSSAGQPPLVSVRLGLLRQTLAAIPYRKIDATAPEKADEPPLDRRVHGFRRPATLLLGARR